MMSVYATISSVNTPIVTINTANAGPRHKSPAAPSCSGMSLTSSTNDAINMSTIWTVSYTHLTLPTKA